ncbi:MAG TPA: calcium/proton exchanger [Trueperaceae bacterium]
MRLLYWLLAFVPIAFYLEYSRASPASIFVSAGLAILPLAGLLGNATERLAARTNSTVGGLLNATFGNASELIIAFFALEAGKFGVVKASISGSIIGNLLLVLGMALFMGGLRHTTQTFNARTAQVTASLLTISVIAFMVPALFDFTERTLGVESSAIRVDDARLALGVAIVLIILYTANLVFTLVTHSDLLSTADETHETGGEAASPFAALSTLVVATVLVAFMAEFLVGSLEGFTRAVGLSEYFVGIIIIPIVGNAAEHAAAVLFAMKGKMDLAVTIALGSTIQVALLVGPLLVVLSFLIGKPMDLVLHNPLELVTLAGAVLIANSVARDGETNWLEGLMLLGVYLIVATAFFFLPSVSS